MKIILAIFCGLCTGIVVYIITPHVLQWVKAYLARIARKVDPILSEINWDLPPIKRTLFYGVGPIASIIISIIIFKKVWLIILVAAVLSLLTYNLSYLIVNHMKKRRINVVKKQLVDALGLVSNALRSGLSIQQGFQMVAEEMPPPISQEFRMVVSSQQLGKTFDAALMELKERVPLEEIDLLISSLVILRETGGNMIETLEVITHTIREEQRVKSKIKTATTQGVAQAVVISLLPFFLAGALYVISPEYILPLFQYKIGWALIAFMLLLQGTGIYIMKKIVTIKV